MAQIAFDTLSYTKILRDAGFTEQQAEALAKAQNEAFAQMADTKELATKRDIAELRQGMAEMEARLVKSFHNALYGFAGLIIAAIACAVAILK